MLWFLVLLTLVLVLMLLRWASRTYDWLTNHWNYHVALHKAICALESVAYDGVSPATAEANRLCPKNPPVPDDYKQPPPPPVFG